MGVNVVVVVVVVVPLLLVVVYSSFKRAPVPAELAAVNAPSR